MKRSRGFSMVELMIALVIGGILLGVAVAAVRPAQDKLAVRSARGALVSLHAKARAHAIERGTRTDLHLHLAGDSAWIASGGTVLETYHFDRRHGVQLGPNAQGPVQLCMTARGIADMTCFQNQRTIRLLRNDERLDVTIMPLGQLVY